MYIRNGDVMSSADKRFSDLGMFQFATVGMQAASVIGELWVSYHVELIRPKLHVENPVRYPLNGTQMYLTANDSLTTTVGLRMGVTGGYTVYKQPADPWLTLKTGADLGKFTLLPGCYNIHVRPEFDWVGATSGLLMHFEMVQAGVVIDTWSYQFNSNGPDAGIESSDSTSMVTTNGNEEFFVRCTPTFGAGTVNIRSGQTRIQIHTL
jgi:hypothetical protein